MKLLKDKHFITKSFWCMGKRLDHCYDCTYCRECDFETEGFDINTVPTDVNPLFDRIPVAVNLFYGDPLLQIDHTLEVLHKLEKANHKGPVIVITKGDFSKFPNIDTPLDLHFAFSTFGINHGLDGGTVERFTSNVIRAQEIGKYKYSIEFRPIIYGVNDDLSVARNILMIARDAGMAVGFSGLQGKPGVVEAWEYADVDIKPFPGTKFGFSKPLPDKLKNYIQWFYPAAFRKTSCLISYTHGLERDYNAHYYRPNEMGCSKCIMKDKCSKFFNKLPNVEIPKIPFDYEIVYEAKHVCAWLHKGCSFPTDDCSNLHGHFIKIDQKLTTSDVRMIKWLTGMTVIADFEEIPYLSENWKNV